MTSVVEHSDWLKKTVNQVLSTKQTIIYSKVVVSCGPNLLEIRFYRCIFVLVIWTLLRELDNDIYSIGSYLRLIFRYGCRLYIIYNKC